MALVFSATECETTVQSGSDARVNAALFPVTGRLAPSSGGVPRASVQLCSFLSRSGAGSRRNALVILAPNYLSKCGRYRQFPWYRISCCFYLVSVVIGMVHAIYLIGAVVASRQTLFLPEKMDFIYNLCYEIIIIHGELKKLHSVYL